MPQGELDQGWAIGESDQFLDMTDHVGRDITYFGTVMLGRRLMPQRAHVVEQILLRVFPAARACRWRLSLLYENAGYNLQPNPLLA